MKHILIALILALTVQACKTESDAGPCVGLADEKDDGFVYELSYRNVFLAALFAETLIVPAVVIAKYLECPKEITK